MIWVRILVRCAFELALASYLSIRRVGDPGGAKIVTSYAGMVPGYGDPLDMMVFHGLTGVDRMW